MPPAVSLPAAGKLLDSETREDEEVSQEKLMKVVPYYIDMKCDDYDK